MKLTEIFNKKVKPDEARLSLVRWYNEIEEFDENCLNKVPDTFQNNYSNTI